MINHYDFNNMFHLLNRVNDLSVTLYAQAILRAMRISLDAPKAILRAMRTSLDAPIANLS